MRLKFCKLLKSYVYYPRTVSSQDKTARSKSFVFLPNGMLRLQAEQVSGREVVYLPDAGRVRAVLLRLAVRHVLWVQVAVQVADEVVEGAEQQPSHDEAVGERQEDVPGNKRDVSFGVGVLQLKLYDRTPEVCHSVY